MRKVLKGLYEKGRQLDWKVPESDTGDGQGSPKSTAPRWLRGRQVFTDEDDLKKKKFRLHGMMGNGFLRIWNNSSSSSCVNRWRCVSLCDGTVSCTVVENLWSDLCCFTSSLVCDDVGVFFSSVFEVCKELVKSLTAFLSLHSLVHVKTFYSSVFTQICKMELML